MKPLPKTENELPGLYENTIQPLIDYILTHWDGLKDIKPKGWDEMVPDYNDFDGMEDIDTLARDMEFNGYNDASAGSFPFHIRTLLPHVMYSEKCQGIGRLQTLFGALIGYGYRIRDNIAKEEMRLLKEEHRKELDIWRKSNG